MAILTSMRWCVIAVLLCISLMISDVEHLFICLVANGMSSLEKCLSGPLLVCVFGVELYKFFTNIIRCITDEYALQFSRLSFHFVDGFLCCAKTFSFNVVYLSFCFPYRRRYIRKKHCYEKYQIFYWLCFLVGVLWFQVLPSTHKSSLSLFFYMV